MPAAETVPRARAGSDQLPAARRGLLCLAGARRGLFWLAAAAALGSTTPLAAQPGARKSTAAPSPGGERAILVLQAAEDRRPGRAAAHVERSLQKALRELGFVVNGSPMPFRDAQLAAGCPGTVRECGTSVAEAAESGRLAVSVVQEHEGEPTLSLHLYAFSAHGEAREGESVLPTSSLQALESGVRQLARSVYGPVAPRIEALAARERPARRRELSSVSIPASEPNAGSALLAPVAPAPASTLRDPRWVAGWSTVGLGSALLVSGIATQLAGRGNTEPDARSGKREDREWFAAAERGERQQDAARVLYGAGGALLLTGATLLVWERVASNRDNTLRAALLPFTHGAALSVAGSFGGARP